MREIRTEGEPRMRPVRVLTAALLLTVTLLAGCLGGCAVKAEEPDDGRLKVVTTIFPQYDFARAISGAGERASVKMLLKPGEEVHSYEPTPLDIKQIQNCDLFIYVGAENDVWVERILENMDGDGPRTLRLVDLTDTVAEETVEGMMEEKGHDHSHSHEEGEEHDHEAESAEEHAHEHEAQEEHEEHTHSGDSSHEEHEEADEHVWTSPVKAAQITEAIAQTMAQLDPENAQYYRDNACAYEEQILELDRQFREIAENAQRRTVVFGDRFPIRYFAEEYGLEYYAAFAGCSSESEPSASTLAFLIDKVREEKIPVVFSIEFSNGNIARAICESTGAAQRTFYSCHNVTRDQMESGATYVSMMNENLEVIREALGKGE